MLGGAMLSSALRDLPKPNFSFLFQSTLLSNTRAYGDDDDDEDYNINDIVEEIANRTYSDDEEEEREKGLWDDYEGYAGEPPPEDDEPKKPKKPKKK